MVNSDIKIKHSGQVFTPDYLANNILDCAGYKGNNILCKHVIDNSCGDGAFLCLIVQRYCTEYLKINDDKSLLAKDLETYIHGIEIDKLAFDICIENLDQISEEFQLRKINWNVINEDAMKVHQFDNIMDYVIGNPPYVRVHNLDDMYDQVKAYSFATGGMTDLYLVFYEIGLNMLKNGGVLCYITPSSWINSIAGINLRTYIYTHKCMREVIDLAHYQAFEAMTYTMITLLIKNKPSKEFVYYKYDGDKKDKVYVDTLSYNDAFINGNLFLGSKNAISVYKNMISSNKYRYVTVKNGFATLADKVFISDSFPFNDMVIPVIKGSTGKWRKAFFPYNKDGKPLNKETIFKNKEVASYLNSNKAALLKGKKEKEKNDWYLYGRTQALKDVFQYKISINSVIKDIKSIKLNEVKEGCGVYSGLYIVGLNNFDLIKHLILSQEFIDYISLLKKYKSGGYYTFNSKDLELFLNYKLTNVFKKNDEF
ncbi:MAG: N-6 DNA methylase [Prevotella sp.]|nr:N-6 DNA methylase [Prevotella sp.]